MRKHLIAALFAASACGASINEGNIRNAILLGIMVVLFILLMIIEEKEACG